jgi:hypothetical protein
MNFFLLRKCTILRLIFTLATSGPSDISIQALSAALAAKFYTSPGRWQHFCLWPMFLLRDKGKQKEMTGTQLVGTLKHQFLCYITIKMELVLFHYKNYFYLNSCFLHLSYFGSDIYRQQVTTFSTLA